MSFSVNWHDKILSGDKNGIHTAMMLIDFQKVFDTLDSKNLLH